MASELHLRLRTGYRPSLSDKIATATSLEELDRFAEQLQADGRRLNSDELAVMRDRRRQLSRVRS